MNLAMMLHCNVDSQFLIYDFNCFGGTWISRSARKKMCMVGVWLCTPSYAFRRALFACLLHQWSHTSDNRIVTTTAQYAE